MLLLAIILIMAAIIVAVIYGHFAANQRSEALAGVARKLGLQFSAEEDPGLAERLSFLRHLDDGSNRYAYNRLSGNYQGHAVMVFDYHYETYSTSKHGRRTHHHRYSIFTLRLPRAFPELLISPEGLLSKIAQAFGYDDIDFESAEFSRKFCVRSTDKKFAYDVCNALMMEYLLAHPDLAIEIDGNLLALAFKPCLEVPEVEPRLQQLVAIRGHLPDYLFTRN
jgi:hypothetical protein